MSEKVKITFDSLGKPTIEAIGFVGRSCTEATSAIERALSGGAGGVTTYKPEFDQIVTEDQSSTVANGWGA